MIPEPSTPDIQLEDKHRQLIKLNLKRSLGRKQFFEQKEIIKQKALQCLKKARKNNYRKQYKQTVVKYFKKYHFINKKPWPDWTYVVLPSPEIIWIIKRDWDKHYKQVCDDLWLDYALNQRSLYSLAWDKRKDLMNNLVQVIYKYYCIDETYTDYDWRAECFFKSMNVNDYIL